MRYRNTHLLRKTGLSALLALLFALGAGGAAQAQLPLFGDVDWLLDRGNVSFDATTSGIPLRQGINNINSPANSPGHGARRFNFPRTFDLTNGTTNSPSLIVDNPNDADPQNFSDTNSHNVRTSSAYPMQTGLDPQQMAHAYLNGGWTLPLVPADGSVNDYRAPKQGFSINSDPTKFYSFDYAFVLAAHNDFAVNRPNGQITSATPAELAALPNVSPEVYAGVQNALVNDTHPTATYASGAYNLQPGTYGVDIYSPGDGTYTGGISHPNVKRALVRVSWFRTVDAAGNIVKANTDNPTFSRIYEVDLSQAGWIRVQGGGGAQTVFPYNGIDPRDQIAVTIYSISPEVYTGANDPVYPSAPMVTADAVRFTANTIGGPGLNLPLPSTQRISASGHILGPVVGTNKLLFTSGGVPIVDVEPLLFFAREETTADPRINFPTDPTLPVSAANPLIQDPTSVVSAPVFYCIDSQNGNVASIGGNGFLPSKLRVRWRYVGAADADDVSATSSASPMIANVRCRDGVKRTIVYFITTSVASAQGHIYAFDAIGDRTQFTTRNYWTYPSYRPLTLAEQTANQFPTQYHDPNYKGFNAGAYPAPIWGADIADPFFHYDGEIVKNPAQAGEFIVRSDTVLPAFRGMQGSPVIIDDPSAPGGGQILVIGNMNGHVYAFDAGGRGDFNPADITTIGTTQRIWTWPHFGADAYYAKNLIGTNKIVDETSVGAIPGSVAYDPSYPGLTPAQKPILVPAGNGHLYAINPPHDTVPAVNAANIAVWQERRNWIYPAADTLGLGEAPSTPAIFQPAGAGFPYVYFTCAGRTYALQEVPPVISGTPPTTNPLKWVFPFTPNPPLPGSDGTQPLDFKGTAPVLMSQATLNSAGTFPSSPAVTNDYCYVLQSNGTLYGLNALNGTVLGSGSTLSTATTEASPIAALLFGNPNFSGTSPAETNPQPTIVFPDDNGAIHGLAARPDTSRAGTNGGVLLTETWGHNDAVVGRVAPASLVSGLILEGDVSGQLHAYGIGTGFDGLGDTTGPGEPTEVVLGGNGPISIDMRVLDFYSAANYNQMMQTAPGGKTANRKTAGGGYTNSVLPIGGNLNDTSSTGAYAVDWGDFLYIAAAGVYHAQPQDDPMNPLGATGPPTVTVTFTITMPQGGTVTQVVTVPATTVTPHSAGNQWPDDLAITAAEHNAMQIYGIDNALGPKVLQGRDQNVYPWIARARIMIDPAAVSASPIIGTLNGIFLPGSGYRVTATAVLTQPVEGTATSNTLAVGQADYAGLNSALPTGSSNPAAYGIPRRAAITNPIAVTTRGITNTNDMTGAANRNVIGLFPSINSPIKPAYPGELLNNGNVQTLPGVNTTNAAVKSLFAPMTMVPDGATSTYSAVDNVGNQQAGLFIVDRSNLANTGQGFLSKRLQVQIVPAKLYWHGWGPSSNPTSKGSSVMNPLPWEQLPNDGQDSLDYPSIPVTAFTIQKSTGEDAIGGRVTITPPNFPSNDPTLRQLIGTPFTLQVKVPRYQPANVNYGVHTFNGVTFGSVYTDLSGTNRGDSTAGATYNQHILGPLITNTGDQAALGSGPVYPAGGYISGFEVRVISSGVGNAGGSTGTFSPAAGFAATRRLGASPAGTGNYVAREVEVGISVPPGIKMRIAETTLDIGKVPHGTGYTPLIVPNDARSFQVPFAPDMSPPTGPPSPGPYWDNANLGGQFFQPFTLYNESNVNLVDVRMAKLLGQNFSQISGRTLSQYTDLRAGIESTATAVSAFLSSDQVNGQSISPLFAVPFKNVSGAPGVGNIGYVSSFDHQSSSSNSVSSLFPERPLWPIANPFVAAADIASANQNYGAMLPTANNPAAGIMGWFDGVQPQPTIGKPRIGDSTGRIASIPDQPYSGNVAFQRPRLGVAIPIGTPVGTYSAPVYAFEDNTPIQWQEWLSHYSKPAGVSQNYPVSHDDILNVSQTGSPSEPFSSPGTILKVAVREAKLSRGATAGDLQMFDALGSWSYLNYPELRTPPGADNFPAAYMAPGIGSNVFSRNLFAYWATNRRQTLDYRIDQTSRPGYPNGTGLPMALAPFTLAFSSMPAPYSAVSGTNIIIGDFDFGNPQPVAGNGVPLSAWWNVPAFPQYDNTTIYSLFPASASGTTPFLPGKANVDTMRLVHPAVAPSVDFSNGYGVPNPNDPEAYLVWQGQVDKFTDANSGAFQTRDSRISWRRLFGGSNPPGVPDGPFYAMPNDPGLTKLAPRPLLVKLPAANGAPTQKFLYVFFHQGNQANASIYYNAMVSANLATPFDNSQWLVDANKNPLGDSRLPTPGALVWQSDPAPVYRHIAFPYGSNQMIDAIDVVYTGVLKGRQTVETLLSRYKINRTAPVNPGDPPIGSLTLIPVRKVVREAMTRIGSSNTFQARDAAWALGTGPQGTLDPAVDINSQIAIFHPVAKNTVALLNPLPSNGNLPQLGRYDQASGLLTFDNTLMGGQILVDMRSGTIRFPQVVPDKTDTISIDYIPYVMRLNTSRDDSNLDTTNPANFGNLGGAPAFRPTAAITSSGNNTSPVVIFDRALNPRTLLTAPQVVFPNGANPTIDRMWVLYRKNDPSGVAKSTIYYKSMRLMVKLPYPVLLTQPAQDGSQQIASPLPIVTGNAGPYEVDYVRGRIYFTEADENSPVSVSYNYYDPVSNQSGSSGTLAYRVAWGDEISASIQQGDQTTPDVALPTDSAVSEGQVAAFKDPFLDKLWVFWSSTRAGSTDLYFETIAPQFYPVSSNQR